MAEYIDYILQSGKNIEFFIEGTRSRSGKVLPPKFGILKYIFESFLNKNIKNAILLPLTINYENVLEINQLLNEWFGRSKKKENLTQLIKALGILQNNYGDIFVKIGKPIHLSVFAEKFPNANFDTLLENLAHDVAHQLQRNTLVMNTGLVAIIFLIHKSDIIFAKFFKHIEYLVDSITALGGKINKNNENELILKSCKFFDFLEVDHSQKIISLKSKLNTFNSFKLLYYKNFSLYLFIKDAILVSILQKPGSSKEIPVSELQKSFDLFTDFFREESFGIKFEDTLLIDYLKHNNLGIYEIEYRQNQPFVILLGAFGKGVWKSWFYIWSFA